MINWITKKLKFVEMNAMRYENQVNSAIKMKLIIRLKHLMFLCVGINSISFRVRGSLHLFSWINFSNIKWIIYFLSRPLSVRRVVINIWQFIFFSSYFLLLLHPEHTNCAAPVRICDIKTECMFNLSMFIFDFNPVFSFILLLYLGKSQNDLVWTICPLFTPWLCGQVFGCLEPCNCWDWISNNVKEAKCIFSFCGGKLVRRLDEFWLFSFGSKWYGSLFPVLTKRLKWAKYERQFFCKEAINIDLFFYFPNELSHNLLPHFVN